MKYFKKKIEKNSVNAPLIEEISEYVEKILDKNMIQTQIPFSGYKAFYRNGSRKEFEDSYFERRKQLTAFGLYLQWNNSEKAIDYFQELLWQVSNEFSWCLAAHLHYGNDEFQDEPSKIIDLFSSETAETLCEILMIHEDKIDQLLYNHIRKQIEERVIEPFIQKTWEWETAAHNWSAVCGGCIGITALLMEDGEKQKVILDKVENALKCYMTGFGDDGAALEGIGYWSYGFGYYMYYEALKNEIMPDMYAKDIKKIKAIGNFPQSIQISDELFIPFSDVPPSMSLPSGLISYLSSEYDIRIPYIKQISSFDFDHCYRWAHVSRNLWWTSEEILNKDLENASYYLENAQWMIHRKDNMFLGIKGGSNAEPHNHNDVGSFVLAIDGEILLADLGAGSYTKGYFGIERYTYAHTRSYWHSVPLINNIEQSESQEKSRVINHEITEQGATFEIELPASYAEAEINEFTRKMSFDDCEHVLILNDKLCGKDVIDLNEGFISYIKPEISEVHAVGEKPQASEKTEVLGKAEVSEISGVSEKIDISEELGTSERSEISEVSQNNKIIWKGKKGQTVMTYDSSKFKASVEEKEVLNHYNEPVKIYRTGLVMRDKKAEEEVQFTFHCEII